MTTAIRRRAYATSVAPISAAASVGDHAGTPAAAFSAALLAALQEIEHAEDDRIGLRLDPAADVRAAPGALVVDGYVMPGLRFVA